MSDGNKGWLSANYVISFVIGLTSSGMLLQG